MQATHLINRLKEETQQAILQVRELQLLEMDALNWRSNPESWSILECLAHLNLYGHFYLPEFELNVTSSNSKPAQSFKSGLLGNYFAKSMLPKAKLNKMKTFKDKNPLNTKLHYSELETFIQQQERLLQILIMAEKVNLNNVKIPTTLSRFLKLNLGDALQFYSNHIIRHLHQINNIQAQRKAAVNE